MITMRTIVEWVTGKPIVEAVAAVMKNCMADFTEVEDRYDAAMCKLRAEGVSVTEEMDAIWQQAASSLFFSGVLGIKANLNHFVDPVARDFLDVDFETFLREDLACGLPMYTQAQMVRNRFCATLSAEQREVYEDVVTYVSYLETAGPKLAHYYGYLLGNELLYRIVPGYQPDLLQTRRYQRVMEGYFGVPIPEKW